MTYYPRHSSHDASAHARVAHDQETARQAIRVLAAVRTPESRELYARLHRAGVLHAQFTRNIPASLIIAAHDHVGRAA